MKVLVSTTEIHYTEVHVGTTGPNLHYKTSTYFTDTGIPVGTTGLILILLIREYP